MAWFSQEIAENFVATVVDFASILSAYNLGLLQLGIVAGLAYAAFDAYVVIWMRTRITSWVRVLLGLVRPRTSPGMPRSQSQEMR